MEMLFSQEEVWEMTKKEIARDLEQQGVQKGIEAGICAMITTLQELSFSQGDTAQKLVSKFALPFQVAAEKVKQYWVQ